MIYAYARHKLRGGGFIEIKYELRDRERWIVWCHGASSNKDNARADAVNNLAGSLNVSFVALDARGGDGQSTRLEVATFEDWIKDVGAIARSGPRRAASHIVLMGHSRGAYAAAWVSVIQSKWHCFKGIVMISAAFAASERRMEEIGDEGILKVLREGRYEYQKWNAPHILTRAQFVVEQSYPDALLIDLWRSIPALIIHGSQDAVIPVKHAQDFAKSLRERHKDVELIVLPGIDHRFKDQEQAVIQQARPFLERVFK